MSSSQHENRFKELQERNKKISESAIKLNAQIENAQENHKKLQSMAMTKFGTSDIEELKKLLLSQEQQNETELAEFEQQITSLEKEVTQKNQIIRQIQQS